jgi:hypothetical protein
MEGFAMDTDQHEGDAARLADDVLLGAKEIAKHVAAILGKPVNENDIYYAHRSKRLPIGKLGAFLIASKKRIGSHVARSMRGTTAA